MCTLFEEIANESRAEGEAKGKATGIIMMLKKYNEPDSNILKELMAELGISFDRAKEYLTMYQKGML